MQDDIKDVVVIGAGKGTAISAHAHNSPPCFQVSAV